jgi:hypothetical protein
MGSILSGYMRRDLLVFPVKAIDQQKKPYFRLINIFIFILTEEEIKLVFGICLCSVKLNLT